MKTQLEAEDIQAIAIAVIEKIVPYLTDKKHESEEIIFSPETLAQYLQVETSWVYKAVSNKVIPYFKSGKYIRFKKSSIDRWIASQERQPIPLFKQLKNSRVSS